MGEKKPRSAAKQRPRSKKAAKKATAADKKKAKAPVAKKGAKVAAKVKGSKAKGKKEGVKRVTSAFFFFQAERRPELKKEKPDLPVKEIVRVSLFNIS